MAIKPTQAIIIYKDDFNSFIEAIKIKEKNNMFFLGETYPVTKEYIKDLSTELNKMIKGNVLKSMQVNFTFPGLLFVELGIDNKIAWISKPQTRSLSFRCDTVIHDGKCKLPELLWIADGYNTHVYPIKKSRNGEHKIYASPFLNMYEHGVCWGNTNIKELKYIKTIEEYCELIESKFFESRFSHAGSLTKTIGNSELFWQEIMSKEKPELSIDNCILQSTTKLKYFIEDAFR